VECGRVSYFALWPRYLYPAPPKGVQLFESHLRGLVFPASLGEKCGIGKMRGVKYERLKVLDEPLDGLPPLYF
jgi:hypothetical protein